MEVIGNILTTTRDYADSDECTGITHLIRSEYFPWKNFNNSE